MGRTWFGSASTIVLLASLGLAACSSAEPSPTSRTPRARPDFALDCEVVNGGTVDHFGGTGSSDEPEKLAERWQGDRFQDARLRTLARTDTTADVVFERPDGSRVAFLRYVNDGKGWQLDGLTSC